MKICPSCGVSQSDRRTECVECGARLDAPLNEQEAERVRAQQEEQLEKLYNRRDPLYVSLFDKILGGLMAAGALAVPITLLVGHNQVKPSIMAFAAFLFFAFGVVLAFFPKIAWEIGKLRMSVYMDGTDDLMPAGGTKGRKIGLTVLLVFGIGAFCLMFTEYSQGI